MSHRSQFSWRIFELNFFTHIYERFRLPVSSPDVFSRFFVDICDVVFELYQSGEVAILAQLIVGLDQQCVDGAQATKALLSV